MTLADLVKRTAGAMPSDDLQTRYLEAEVIVGHVLGLTREKLVAGSRVVVPAPDVEAVSRLVERRVGREPLAYITGHREFYGFDFLVDSRVLIPRPETELLVGEAIGLARRWEDGSGTIVDVGTGSGCIAVSLALNLPAVVIWATDVSTEALEVAGLNCRRHGVDTRIGLYCSDLLDGFSEPLDMIVANLPYVREDDFVALTPEINQYEPRMALLGGADGLDVIRRLVDQASKILRLGGYLLLEIGEGQAVSAGELVRQGLPGATVSMLRDLAGVERLVVAKLSVR
jgi:release factor glutamine methyltransferase